MARTIVQILATMDAEQAAQPALSGLTSTSATAIYKLFKYIVAVCVWVNEQLWDAKEAQIEAILNSGVTPSTAWVRGKAFEFQYDASVPQVIELVNMIPTYNPVDPTKRIITRCCVSTIAGAVTVIVAKNEPPEVLTAPELAAINGYFTNTGNGTNQAVGIGWGGQAISVYSADPDLLYIEATITYSGLYAATIEADCKLAFDNYISNLGQNPIIRTNALIDALQAVPGFIDIQIANLSLRDAATAWAGVGTGTWLINAGDILLTQATVVAGYAIGETTATFTFADDVTFTAV